MTSTMTGSLRTRDERTERGFTLVELMIVVVIVGVLATLGVVGFQKLVGTARTTEATQMIQSIKAAQEAFHAETGTYADISKGGVCVAAGCGNLYPQAVVGGTLGSQKFGWGVSCLTTGAVCNTGMDWLQLPVHTQGAVMYGYTTEAGLAGSTTSSVGANAIPSAIGSGATAFTVTAPTTTPADWYLVTAVGNSDDSVLPCVVFGSSFQSDLIVWNEGN
jgi:type IV pilus assembly protein PilA